MPSLPPTVLLDLDGTIIDSEPGIVASCRAALLSLGLAMPPQPDIARLIGPPIADVMAYLLGAQGDDRVAEAVAAYRADYGARGLFDCRLYAGIETALRDLHAAGMPLVLATSKRRDFAERILENLGLLPLFAAVYGSGPATTSPHKDEMIAGILAERGLDPRAAVMVGDRRFDIAGAHANRLRAIGVLWGYGARNELEECGADLLLHDPADLTPEAVRHALGSAPRAD
ncbi:phosphoglycolate phosphatase [Aureimonas endophytica]|uniref:Phosphoglycolate phosphatase n=1 Tax=Aureimonas endophytica TaxID=2027858 RepID=A0A916ZFF5_9HYPH|nr:HAD hydrolase-like protein [Aureimonas endophytica]GGD91818.1 phosphoglycolate phosphatase [Aureimonas endophytica]